MKKLLYFAIAMLCIAASFAIGSQTAQSQAKSLTRARIVGIGNGVIVAEDGTVFSNVPTRGWFISANIWDDVERNQVFGRAARR